MAKGFSQVLWLFGEDHQVTPEPCTDVNLQTQGIDCFEYIGLVGDRGRDDEPILLLGEQRRWAGTCNCSFGWYYLTRRHAGFDSISLPWVGRIRGNDLWRKVALDGVRRSWRTKTAYGACLSKPLCYICRYPKENIPWKTSLRLSRKEEWSKLSVQVQKRAYVSNSGVDVCSRSLQINNIVQELQQSWPPWTDSVTRTRYKPKCEGSSQSRWCCLSNSFMHMCIHIKGLRDSSRLEWSICKSWTSHHGIVMQFF